MKTMGPWDLGGPIAEREQHTKASHRWIKICASKRGTQWGKICHGYLQNEEEGLYRGSRLHKLGVGVYKNKCFKNTQENLYRSRQGVISRRVLKGNCCSRKLTEEHILSKWLTLIQPGTKEANQRLKAGASITGGAEKER